MVSSQCLQGWIQFSPLVSPDVDAGNEPPANRKHEGTVPELIEFSSSSQKRRRPIQQNDMGSQRCPVSSAAITQSTSDAFERTIGKLIESSSSSGQGSFQGMKRNGGCQFLGFRLKDSNKNIQGQAFHVFMAKRAQRWFNYVPQTNEDAVERGIVTCFSPKLPKGKLSLSN
ncbi:hypothetical protein Tco_1293933 [Tanacetum coccineum]